MKWLRAVVKMCGRLEDYDTCLQSVIVKIVLNDRDLLSEGKKI